MTTPPCLTDPELRDVNLTPLAQRVVAAATFLRSPVAFGAASPTTEYAGLVCDLWAELVQMPLPEAVDYAVTVAASPEPVTATVPPI